MSFLVFRDIRGIPNLLTGNLPLQTIQRQYRIWDKRPNPFLPPFHRRHPTPMAPTHGAIMKVVGTQVSARATTVALNSIAHSLGTPNFQRAC